jgi:hypothetical protein
MVLPAQYSYDNHLELDIVFVPWPGNDSRSRIRQCGGSLEPALALMVHTFRLIGFMSFILSVVLFVPCRVCYLEHFGLHSDYVHLVFSNMIFP